MRKKALITGITGQDGSYLAEFLLEKGYRVAGMVRHSGTVNLDRIQHILARLELHHGDLLDQPSLISLIEKVEPDEVYNLAAQTFIPTSWQQPVLNGELTALGVTRLLEAIRLVNSRIRFYQASSSEMFGKVLESPQNEKTPFCPRSPYGVSKVYGHFITVNYRESHGLFACSGILFNHESPRRAPEFVSRKVTQGVARIKMGLEKQLELRDLDSSRDWGFAGDYVEAMWRMLQLDHPDDFVIGSGRIHTVRQLVDKAFKYVGLSWKKYVSIDKSRCRPFETARLVANPSKARKKLGWKPTVNFDSLIQMMVDADLKKLAEKQPEGSCF